MSKWLKRSLWAIPCLIAFALGVAVGHGDRSFSFLTPEQFAQILTAFSGYGWPLAIVILAVVFRRPLGQAIIILAWRFHGFKAAGVEGVFGSLSTPQARSQLRQRKRAARVGQKGAEDAVVMARLERRTEALLKAAQQLSELTSDESDAKTD